MAAVLGFVGAGGLGQLLYFHLSIFQQAQASTLLIAMLKFDERALKASINTLLESIQAEDFEGKVRRLKEEQDERKRRTRAHVASVAVASALFLAFSVTLLDFFGLSAHIASSTMLLAHVAAPARAWAAPAIFCSSR